jgi:hypothetical protein
MVPFGKILNSMGFFVLINVMGVITTFYVLKARRRWKGIPFSWRREWWRLIIWPWTLYVEDGDVPVFERYISFDEGWEPVDIEESAALKYWDLCRLKPGLMGMPRILVQENPVQGVRSFSLRDIWESLGKPYSFGMSVEGREMMEFRHKSSAADF